MISFVFISFFLCFTYPCPYQYNIMVIAGHLCRPYSYSLWIWTKQHFCRTSRETHLASLTTFTWNSFEVNMQNCLKLWGSLSVLSVEHQLLNLLDHTNSPRYKCNLSSSIMGSFGHGFLPFEFRILITLLVSSFSHPIRKRDGNLEFRITPKSNNTSSGIFLAMSATSYKVENISSNQRSGWPSWISNCS